jgi:hypothetical protein
LSGDAVQITLDRLAIDEPDDQAHQATGLHLHSV